MRQKMCGMWVVSSPLPSEEKLEELIQESITNLLPSLLPNKLPPEEKLKELIEESVTNNLASNVPSPDNSNGLTQESIKTMLEESLENYSSSILPGIVLTENSPVLKQLDSRLSQLESSINQPLAEDFDEAVVISNEDPKNPHDTLPSLDHLEETSKDNQGVNGEEDYKKECRAR